MENLYKILSIIFIITSILLIAGVASYVTEKSGLSGIMGMESKQTNKKLSKEEIIQKYTSIIAYIFLFLVLLLSIISQQIYNK
jgi:protein translocase SecG subunit